MKNWKKKFIEFSFKKKALKFGEFHLKSGRISPYFFDLSSFSTGKDLIKLGKFYAHAIVNSKIKFDTLFGLAYKGIPIVTATAIALSLYYNFNCSYCFNRKEKKQYGEKGLLIGNQLHGKILILDDVITAGTAVHDCIKIIQENHAKPSIILVGLDRQEFGKNKFSAKIEIEKQYKCKVISIITMKDLIFYLSKKKCTFYHYYWVKLLSYRSKYGT